MQPVIALAAAALAFAAMPATAQAQHHAGHQEHAEHTQHAEHSAHHQAEDAEAVMAVVEQFMDGLAARDADVMSSLVTEQGFLAVVIEMQSGTRTSFDSMENTIAALANIPVEVEEPIFDPHVMSDGLVAMVWAPYDFLVQGNRSHCGVNIFTLMNVDDEWKIATVTYSHFAADTCPVRG